MNRSVIAGDGLLCSAPVVNDIPPQVFGTESGNRTSVEADSVSKFCWQELVSFKAIEKLQTLLLAIDEIGKEDWVLLVVDCRT